MATDPVEESTEESTEESSEESSEGSKSEESSEASEESSEESTDDESLSFEKPKNGMCPVVEVFLCCCVVFLFLYVASTPFPS